MPNVDDEQGTIDHLSGPVPPDDYASISISSALHAESIASAATPRLLEKSRCEQAEKTPQFFSNIDPIGIWLGMTCPTSLIL